MKVFFVLLILLGSTSDKASASRLRIGYPAAGTIVSGQIGLIFAKTDILKRNGIEANVVSLGTGRELKTALVSGQLDVILTSQSNFIVLLGEGFPAKAVNSLGSAGRMALVVPKTSPVRDLKDLRGKKIATIFGTSLHKPAVQWALDAGGAEVVNINQVGALHAALESGQVAAAMTYDPFLTEMEDRMRVLRQDSFGLITVGSETKMKPELVISLNKAFREAVIYLRSNREIVDGWFSEKARLSRKAIRASSEQNINYRSAPGAEVELKISPDLKTALIADGDFLFAQKLIKRRPMVETNILIIE